MIADVLEKRLRKSEFDYDGCLVGECSCLFASRRVRKHAEGARHNLVSKRKGRKSSPDFRDRNPDLVQEKVHRAGHSCRNPPLSTMHSRVHVGEYVLLRLPSDTLKLVHVVLNRFDPSSIACLHAIN